MPKGERFFRSGIYEPGRLMTHTAHYQDAAGMENLFQRAVDKGDN